MCGRLNVIDAPIVAFLAEFLGEVPFVESRGNVAPTEPCWRCARKPPAITPL